MVHRRPEHELGGWQCWIPVYGMRGWNWVASLDRRWRSVWRMGGGVKGEAHVSADE